MKKYKLLGADGKEYLSDTPGIYGGNGKGKVYGRLDCPYALSSIRRFPGVYEKCRVFFADERTALAANIFAYTFGVAMSLVLGVGMCLSMQVLGDGSTVSFVLGIIIGLVGIVGVSVNYPIYKKLLENGKKKYAFDIIELAKQISEADE